MMKNPNFKKLRPNYTQKGIALLMVLWALVLLSIIALNFLKENRWNIAATRNLKEDTIAYYMAVSGYQEAVNYILADKDLNIDFMDNDGNFWVDDRSETVTGKRKTEDGEIEIRIFDEDAKVNVNFASTEMLSRLFQYVGIPTEEITGIIDSILDWKDADKVHHLSGAEDEYYEGLQNPYKTKNGMFSVPEEMALVKGIKPEYLYGSEEFKPLLPLITTFSRNTININTASKDLLKALGLSDVEIEAILKQRNRETGGFRFVPQQFLNYGLNAIASNNFRIEVSASAYKSKAKTKVIGILSRIPDTKGFKIQTVYWRELVDNSRS